MTTPSRRPFSTAIRAAILLVVPMVASAGTFPYPVHARTLENGLRIYVVPMPSEGVVAYGTWMSVGSRDEVEPGRTGFAHFFEHLMFHGTETVPSDVRQRELLRMGADDNAWTWLDETVYHVLLPADALPRMVELEADRFRHLKLVPEGVDREAGAVYGEFRKGQADPDQVLSERLQATAFTAHTYGHDTIGLEADIAAMPDAHEAAVAFFREHYRPEKAAILVVGDVEPEPVFELLAAKYGAWERGTEPPDAIPAEPPQEAERRVHVDWTGPATPRLTLAWRIPAHTADATTARLELAANLLLSPTGPLQRRLVREEGLAWSVWGGREATVDPGLLKVEVAARGAAGLPQVEAIVREEVARLAVGIEQAQLDALRTRLRYALLSSLDDPMTVFHTLGSSIRRDPDPAALDRFQELLAAATPEEVAGAVREHLVDRSLTIATLTPPSEQGTP